ncbi:hypothetical protein AERO8C_50579 [Aeromonas veronii]|uniref:Uncharacterized protein n=1 Tax=Aeromonas veronii TaxID=654 RepID=A0A653L998_AERVE|nr:hypothetical protein AERO8C_50579 [Aeromonas veronii]
MKIKYLYKSTRYNQNRTHSLSFASPVNYLNLNKAKTLITPFIKQNDPACSQSYLEEWESHSLVIQKCADYTAAPL